MTPGARPGEIRLTSRQHEGRGRKVLTGRTRSAWSDTDNRSCSNRQATRSSPSSPSWRTSTVHHGPAGLVHHVEERTRPADSGHPPVGHARRQNPQASNVGRKVNSGNPTNVRPLAGPDAVVPPRSRAPDSNSTCWSACTTRTTARANWAKAILKTAGRRPTSAAGGRRARHPVSM